MNHASSGDDGQRIDADVVVVGDGPAGSAIAQALGQLGVDVMLIGADRPWSATYGTWAEDLERADVLGGADIWLHRFDQIAARFSDLRIIDRAYGVVDNERLRTVLRRGLRHRQLTVRSLDDVAARVVVDCTGWPSSLDMTTESVQTSWQTAYGVILDEAPNGALGAPMLMDFSEPCPPRSRYAVDAPTFAYALPVEDGWLVEETVLAAAPAIDPTALAGKLACRLGLTTAELSDRAIRVEHVRIPMGAPARRSRSGDNVVPYGAAAGMIHPATGYSIAASVTSATATAERIRDALARPGHSGDGLAFDDSVWTRSALRTRSLHAYGLDVLHKMDADGVRLFFDTFFDSDVQLWSAYLRIDSSPSDVARLMRSMFLRSSATLRRQLLRSNPSRLLRALV